MTRRVRAKARTGEFPLYHRKPSPGGTPVDGVAWHVLMSGEQDEGGVGEEEVGSGESGRRVL